MNELNDLACVRAEWWFIFCCLSLSLAGVRVCVLTFSESILRIRLGVWVHCI